MGKWNKKADTITDKMHPCRNMHEGKQTREQARKENMYVTSKQENN